MTPPTLSCPLFSRPFLPPTLTHHVHAHHSSPTALLLSPTFSHPQLGLDSTQSSNVGGSLAALVSLTTALGSATPWLKTILLLLQVREETERERGVGEGGGGVFTVYTVLYYTRIYCVIQRMPCVLICCCTCTKHDQPHCYITTCSPFVSYLQVPSYLLLPCPPTAFLSFLSFPPSLLPPSSSSFFLLLPSFRSSTALRQTTRPFRSLSPSHCTYTVPGILEYEN